jgi:sugar lactone lactonase YvrE
MPLLKCHAVSSVWLLAIMLSAASTAALAENIDPADDGSQYAWGENVGWINLAEPTLGPGVTVADSAVTGFAWGENIGWVNFNPATGGGVVNDGTGQLSGFAWGENTGWINYAPAGGGVSVNACGEFDGAAWGENIGWIRFRSIGPFAFKITTSWVSPVDTVAPVTSAAGPAPGWNTADVSVTLSATDCGSGVREVRHTLDGNPEVVTPGAGAILTITADGIHSLTYFAVDNAGNAEAASVLTIQIDKTPPAITLSSPADGANYFAGQNVAADFTVTDALSGLAGVASTLPDGSPLPTSTVGPGTFNVTATDQAGNGASVTHAYAVVSCPPPPAPAGIVSTFAGGGAVYGDGGPATAARLNGPTGVAVDGSGNVYVADANDFVVRRIDGATGIITTYAGNRVVCDAVSLGLCGNGGPATEAGLSTPYGIALDRSGNLYIADLLNSQIRKVDAATGIITGIAGNGIPIFDGDGGPAVLASLAFPQGVAIDTAGNVYIADTGNFVVRKVTAATGIIDTIAGAFGRPRSGDGGPAIDAGFEGVTRVALDPAGNLYVIDQGSTFVVRRIDAATGIITTVAGGGTSNGESGRAVDANLGQVEDVALDADGNLFIAGDLRVWRVDGDGNIGVFAGTGAAGFSGDGGPAVDATFAILLGVTWRATAMCCSATKAMRALPGRASAG